jgi:hypothetical protein
VLEPPSAETNAFHAERLSVTPSLEKPAPAAVWHKAVAPEALIVRTPMAVRNGRSFLNTVSLYGPKLFSPKDFFAGLHE